MAEEKTPAPEVKKAKQKKAAPGAPLWMVTYSDMVTLLLTFFVLLLSMASLDPVAFTEASSSLRDAFGTYSSPSNIEFSLPILPSPPKTPYTPLQQSMTTRVYEQIKSQIELKKLSQDIDAVKKDSDTIILRVNDSVLFKPGQSQVPTASYPVLRTISDIIRPLPMRLRIEGHTDDLVASQNPIGNWDLSVARAVSVMRFFKQGDLLSLDRMAAIGYGADQPIVPNKDEISRAKNRRVDFVLRFEALPDSETPTEKKANVPL